MIKQNDVGNLKLTNFTIDFTGLYAQLIICPMEWATKCTRGAPVLAWSVSMSPSRSSAARSRL
jgi:hypothetical protein